MTQKLYETLIEEMPDVEAAYARLIVEIEGMDRCQEQAVHRAFDLHARHQHMGAVGGRTTGIRIGRKLRRVHDQFL